MVHSWARRHAELCPSERIFVYLLKAQTETVTKFYEGTSVTVRCIDSLAAPIATNILGLREMAQADRVDTTIFDSCFGFQICLISARLSAIQLVLELTHSYGNIPEVDGWYLGSEDFRPRLGLPAVFCQSLPYSRDPKTVSAPDRDSAKVIRDSWSPAKIIFGTIGRLCKITEPLLAQVTKLLHLIPDSKYFIGGEGDGTHIYEWIEANDLSKRVIFLNQFTNIPAYGPAIDIFLDTFPFSGGMVCWEMQAFGVPVVTMREPMFENWLVETRNESLLVRSEAEFVDAAAKLANDQVWRQQNAIIATEIAKRTSNIDETVRPIISAITHLRTQKYPTPGTA
jgi:glycosyltransferase involved in cell wall biosynthesis